MFCGCSILTRIEEELDIVNGTSQGFFQANDIGCDSEQFLSLLVSGSFC